LASTLNVVLAQRLVRKICPNCIVKYKPDDAVLARLSKDLGIDLKNQKFYKGEGCSECNKKGYMGRIGIYEVIAVTEKLRSLITQKATSDVLSKAAQTEGAITMLQDGLDKVASGLTTIEEVIRVIREN